MGIQTTVRVPHQTKETTVVDEEEGPGGTAGTNGEEGGEKGGLVARQACSALEGPAWWDEPRGGRRGAMGGRIGFAWSVCVNLSCARLFAQTPHHDTMLVLVAVTCTCHRYRFQRQCNISFARNMSMFRITKKSLD